MDLNMESDLTLSIVCYHNSEVSPLIQLPNIRLTCGSLQFQVFCLESTSQTVTTSISTFKWCTFIFRSLWDIWTSVFTFSLEYEYKWMQWHVFKDFCVNLTLKMYFQFKKKKKKHLAGGKAYREALALEKFQADSNIIEHIPSDRNQQSKWKLVLCRQPEALGRSVAINTCLKFARIGRFWVKSHSTGLKIAVKCLSFSCCQFH